ncbi:porin family protein [Reichenbachiella ulvae]|uniref:Porin family protein n=1 Tax=Reichenbachiella ulvae TaxID=2980104 RepID=A0ABT3CRQ2_9BACT|nr:porin family protein [Reichenbachiella ulvae]MCV9385948.1 porin family protein [Reichenbachiella ulvae]
MLFHKLTLPLIFVLLLSTNSEVIGQKIEHKKWMFGGESNMLTNIQNTSRGSRYLDVKITQIQVTPTIGYFWSDNFAFGIALPLEYRNEQYGSNEMIDKTWFFETFLRYYFGQKRWKPFAQIDAGIGAKITEYNNIDGDDKNSYKIYGGDIGITYSLNENIYVDLSFGYHRLRVAPDSRFNDPYFTDNLGSILGFNIIL